MEYPAPGDPVVQNLISLSQVVGKAICIYCLEALDPGSLEARASWEVTRGWYDCEGKVHLLPGDAGGAFLIVCPQCLIWLGAWPCPSCQLNYPANVLGAKRKDPASPLYDITLLSQLVVHCPECVKKLGGESGGPA